MCEELITFLKDHFEIEYNEFFKENDLKYIILCKKNIDLSRVKIYNGANYYRYGFHIYFFDLKFDINGKKYIKTHFRYSK